MSEQWANQLSRLRILAANNGILHEKDREAIAELLRRTSEGVQISKDGDQMCALIGENIHEGTAGFGDTVPDALRDLANQLQTECAKA
jgi:hypothetical protein